jgi:cation transport ATPase
MERKLSIAHFVLLVAALSLIESALIFFEILPPLSSYSLGDILFTLVKLAVIIWMGIVFYEKGLGKSALYGGILGFTSSSIFSLAAFISSTYFLKPILGISVPSGVSYFLTTAIIIVENILLGMVLAVCASLITKKIKQK